MTAVASPAHEAWSGIDYRPAVPDHFPETLLPYLSPGCRVLDVGCGTGNVVRFLAERGFEAEGVDLNQDAITSAKTHHPEFSSPVFHCQDFLYFQPPATFDAIIMVRFLTCIPEREAWECCLDKAFQILSPGGFLYLHDFLMDTKSPVYGPRYLIGHAAGSRLGNFPVHRPDGSLQFTAHHHTEEDFSSIESRFEPLSKTTHPSLSMNGNPCLMFEFIGRKTQHPKP
jgi:SAM-dependent methyltransferase